MNNLADNKDRTFEEALNDPSLAHVHEFIRYAQKTPFSKMFPKKHEKSLTSLVGTNTRALFQEQPYMPIKKVITMIFDDLTDDIPAPLMLKLTKKIIAEWTKLSEADYERANAVAA